MRGFRDNEVFLPTGYANRKSGRSFRIRHEQSPEAPSGGGLTMMSYPVGNKPRYLGNHAWQLKSYYGTLSGSNGRSFKIRHEKLPEAPNGGEITITSYPACI